MLPFNEAKDGGKNVFISQEYNCGPHRAKSIATYLQSKGVSRMKWPVQSPVLNPIENMWRLLKQRLPKLPKQPTSIDQLFDILPSALDSFSEEYFCTLACSMASRVRKVVNIGRRLAIY